MSGRSSAKNAVVAPEVVYAPDPNGAALFHRLTKSIGDTLRGARVVIVRHPTWHGDCQAPQRFIGQAAALGVASVYAQRAGVMNDQRTSNGTSSADVFYARMAQGRG